jgi:predicted ABC-type ATPase
VNTKARNSKLRIIAGPNGSGKSTLLEYLRTEFNFPLGYCLNPDEIRREIASRRLYIGWQSRINEAALRDFATSHSFHAANKRAAFSITNSVLQIKSARNLDQLTVLLCDFLRQQWLNANESFTFETVMSHASKIDLLKDAQQRGYRTYLYYVCTESDLINVARIQNRVQTGGHDVPADKLRQRRQRSLALLNDALLHSTRAYVFDNSSARQNLIAEFENGKAVRISDKLPRWFVESVWAK